MTHASKQQAPRLLLIAPPESYRIAPYLQAAAALDLPVLIASDGKHSLVNEVAAGLHVNLNNPEQALDTILQAHRQTPFTAVIASDDYTVELAANVAQRLRLPCNPPEANRITRWKNLAREALAMAQLPVP